MKHFKSVILLLIISLTGCNKMPYQLKSHFSENLIPSIPDYSKTENWASLPTKSDPADRIPPFRLITIFTPYTETKQDLIMTQMCIIINT